jgi:hypothetical protein
MALSPYRPIKTRGLFDAAQAGGMTYEDWSKANPTGEMPSIAPGQINDSVADNVTALIGADSKMNQMARTEGLKVMGRRGFLNSTLTGGAVMDSVIRNALPIASQDAAQAYGKNQAARGFEYATQEFAGTQAGLDRALQVSMQQADLNFRGTQADLERSLQTAMQKSSIDAATAAQVRDIASREGMAKAEQAFQKAILTQQQTFAGSQAAADRALTTSQNNADRASQERVASWNLKAEDKGRAASMVLGTEELYAAATARIMANTALSAKDRAAQLKSAKLLHDKSMNAVEQLFNIDLKW